MIIVMGTGVTDEQVEQVSEKLKSWGFGVHLSRGIERTVIGAIGDERALKADVIRCMEGVSDIIPILKPFKLSSREFHAQDTVVKVNKHVSVGAGAPIGMMAGPCSVESLEQLLESAQAVKRAGANMLRGGAFKPRTSPYSFQGLGKEGLELLKVAREETGLPIVTEVMDTRDVELVSSYADVVQVGARNMQNFNLLKELSMCHKPVLLKRGMAATIEELLMSAEYLLSGGNTQVMLCERGIKTMENYTRNTLDISAVPVIKELSHLPVVVDPSHGTGKRHLVTPMALAAVAAGADAIIVEVHSRPEQALCDGPQALTPPLFATLMQQVREVAKAVGRSLAS